MLLCLTPEAHALCPNTVVPYKDLEQYTFNTQTSMFFFYDGPLASGFETRNYIQIH